jgi:glycerol-3-phosphate acyltransferase PlsY
MVIAAALGYIFGSLPFAVWIGRTVGVDPRTIGDGSADWWNLRKASDKRAFIVFGLDALKGAIPAAIAMSLWGPWWWGFVAAFFALLGHEIPAFAGLRGGRSILPLVGAMAVLTPVAAGISLAVGLVVAIAFRRFNYGAAVTVLGIPVYLLFFGTSGELAAISILLIFAGVRIVASMASRSGFPRRSTAAAA